MPEEIPNTALAVFSKKIPQYLSVVVSSIVKHNNDSFPFFLCLSNCMRKSLNVMASNCFSNRVTSRPSVTLLLQIKRLIFVLGPEARLDLSPLAEPTLPPSYHVAGNGTHPSSTNPCLFFLPNYGVFLKASCLGRISMSNQWPWLSQAKSKLMKEPLALPYSQRHLMQFFNMMRQSFPSHIFCEYPKSRGDLRSALLIDFSCCDVKRFGLPAFSAIFQNRQSRSLKTPNPSLNRCRILTEHFSDFAARKTPTNKQHTMQPMVITGILRSKNFVLKSYFITSESDMSSRFMRPSLYIVYKKGRLISNLFMLHYLCRCV